MTTGEPSVRHASRFRDPWTPGKLPVVAGLCTLCLRQMWTHLPENAKGRVAVSGDRRYCEACARHIRTTGNNPQDRRGHAAERVPAERPELDREWRTSGRPRCAGVGGDAFAPDPMPEDMNDDDQAATLELRRYVAAFVCGPCPVARECRAAARVHGYEGVWGGRFFSRNWWIDPLTGLRGPTINTRESNRTRLIARLAEQGYDPDGEPFAGNASA